MPPLDATYRLRGVCSHHPDLGNGFFNGNAGYAVNMAETAPAVPNVDIFQI